MEDAELASGIVIGCDIVGRGWWGERNGCDVATVGEYSSGGWLAKDVLIGL